MSRLLKADQIDQYKKDGAVLIKGKFDRVIGDWSMYLTDKDIFCYNPKKEMLECISRNKEYCNVQVDEV